MKSFGVYYWYVKIPPRGFVDHGFKYITFYVQKHIAHLVACSRPPAGSRLAAMGVRICETFVNHRYGILLLQLTLWYTWYSF